MSNALAVAALVISLASFAYSIYLGQREAPRIRAKSTLRENGRGYSRSLVVEVVNAGRLPIILTMLGGDAGSGSWFGTHLGPPSA